jgi:hypothetical protein
MRMPNLNIFDNIPKVEFERESRERISMRNCWLYSPVRNLWSALSAAEAHPLSWLTAMERRNRRSPCPVKTDIKLTSLVIRHKCMTRNV